eukprot:m.140979 g.140979  ORF g.140979 m.140979 type:complete len:224 (+) comp14048_c0_seq1:1946-2617(+)
MLPTLILLTPVAGLLTSASAYSAHSSEGGGWTTVFSDSFTRPDGPIGASYITGLNGTPPLNITSHAACANTQSVALYAHQLATHTAHRIQYAFTPHSDEGFEAYALAATGSGPAPSNLTTIWVVGCDGGFGQTCTPTIRTVVGAGAAVRGAPIVMTLGTTYNFEATFAESTGVTLTIANSTGVHGNISAPLAAVGAASWFGFLVGRGSQQPSCVSSFEIEASD